MWFGGMFFFILLTNGYSIFFRLFKITHRNAIHVSVYKIVCITNIWHHKKTISHGLFAVALGTSILAFYEFQILNWLFAGWLFMNLCAYKSMCDCVWVFYYFDVFAAALLFKKKRHYFKSKQVKLVQFQRNIKRKRLCFFFHL